MQRESLVYHIQNGAVNQTWKIELGKQEYTRIIVT